MPSVHTRGQQQWRVVKERGTPAGARPAVDATQRQRSTGTTTFKLSPRTAKTRNGFAAFVAKIEQLVHECAFIYSLETLEGM